MEQKKSLLERYGIPINHLDFSYLADCNDAREIEKILHILRSGEEGYYPDLTKSAENRLRELKPNSRLFRVEEQIRGRDVLGAQEWKPIYDWNCDIKDKDQKLQKLNKNKDTLDIKLPPIRKIGRISQESETTSVCNKSNNDIKPTNKITSATDYRKWDQYDADTETLRIDLAEERLQEEVESKNRINARKCKPAPRIEELLEDDKKENSNIDVLTDLEKEKLSEEFRLRGNEYFRAKEYDYALVEYTKAINVWPTKAVAPYNNRALVYFKKQNYLEAIKDCECCLKLEPDNIKARLRLAEASYAYGRRKESYQLYINVLQVDSTNAVALKAINELRQLFEDLPPPNATRLSITDSNSNKVKVATENRDTLSQQQTIQTVKKINKKDEPKPNVSSKKNYDLAELVKPNRVVKNKLLRAAESFGKMQLKTNEQAAINNNENEIRYKNNLNSAGGKRHGNVMDFMSELRMPSAMERENESKDCKPLIEEI